MPDRFKLTTITDYLLLFFFAVFGGAARFCIKPPNNKTLGSAIGSIIVAAFAGFLVFNILIYYDYSKTIQGMGAGIGGLLGHDLLVGFMKLVEKFSSNPGKCVSSMFSSFLDVVASKIVKWAKKGGSQDDD